MKKVAVTGGLSSGKSTVCHIFHELGAFVVSADSVVHKLLSPHHPLAPQLLQLLGEDIRKGEVFDRREIAHRAFADPKILKQLEHLLHPAVLDEIERQYHQIRDRRSHALFIAEVPLLYEIESQHLFDSVITVICDPAQAKSRFTERELDTEGEFDQRMSRQLCPLEKVASADYVIHNNGTFEELKAQVEGLHVKLTQE